MSGYVMFRHLGVGIRVPQCVLEGIGILDRETLLDVYLGSGEARYAGEWVPYPEVLRLDAEDEEQINDDL